MSRSRIGSMIVLILGLALVIIFSFYLYNNADKYLNLLNLSLFPIVAILLATSISLFINGFISVYVFASLGVNLSVRNGFFLAAASTLANQLPVSGGALTRAVYLKNRHNLSYAKFISSTLALFFCFISVNGFIGVLIMLYWILNGGGTVPPILLLGFVLMASCIIVFVIPVEHIKVSGKLQNRLMQALDGWRIIGSKPLLLSKILGLQTLLMFLLAVRYWFAFQMLSQDLGVGQVILFSSGSVLTQLVSIAPGGLGVTETIVGGIASLLGFDMAVSIVAVGLDRLVSTVVIFVVGGISTVILGKQLSDASPDPDDAT